MRENRSTFSVAFRGLTLLVFAFVLTLSVTAAALAEPPGEIPPRPKLAGTLRVDLRERREVERAGEKTVVSEERSVDWQVAETAIIVCDMWENIYCQSAKTRIDEMAPRMNRVLGAARDRGVTIIHAPSGTMDFYAHTAQRRRAQEAKTFEPPMPIGAWCELDPNREPPLPLDVSNPCDDPTPPDQVRVFSRQHPAIALGGFDLVSDNGQEIYNLLKQEGIKNVVLMGVHTNMCVLGRPFGIRQMVKLEMNVVLARDLTDAMYDPRCPPYVSHARGTELIVEHIERYWCPSILGEDLTRVVSGSDGPTPESLDAPRPPRAAGP